MGLEYELKRVESFTLDPFGCKYSWNNAKEDGRNEDGFGTCGHGLKVLWSYSKCTQLHQIQISACKQLILVQKEWQQPNWLARSRALCPSLFLPKRVTLRSVMKREHLCLKCSSIIHPLWTIGTWANKELPLWHVHQNLSGTFTRWECETERGGKRVKEEREILYGRTKCVSGVCFFNKTNNDH